MKVLGIDIGFGFTKATNGTDTMVFKSIFGDASELQFWMDFGDKMPSDFFHVTVDGKSYFIGELAEQQSQVLNFTLDQEKLITEFVKILSLTVAGAYQDQDAEINVPINIVSGLPIGHFKNNHDRFNEILTGHHQVIYHRHNGTKVTKEVYINKILMLPQPLGSILNLLMDENGKIANGDLAQQKIGVVDIGFRTTDLSIMDKLRYIDRGSRTMDTGISKAFTMIANKLREKYGVNVQLYRLYNTVESGTINIKGQSLNLASIRDQVYEQLAGNIANDIDRLWSEDWDIETIVLTGGGSMALAKHLQPLITGNVVFSGENEDARLNNVKGYLKYGKQIWGRAAAESPEPVSASQPKPDETIEEIAELVDTGALEQIDELVEDKYASGRL